MPDAKPGRKSRSRTEPANGSAGPAADQSAGDAAEQPADAAEQPADAAEQPADAPAEPLNRAQRRAQARGKKPPPPAPPGQQHLTGRGQVVVPRRAGRRGNR